MYPQFFGFDKLPFRLRPDPDFLYSGQGYLRARSGLVAGLRGGSRIVLFTGPPGVGKTLLVEDLLREISGQFALCRINQPQVSATELLQALLIQLGVPAADGEANRQQLFTELSASVEAAKTHNAPPLLVIDDAQLIAEGTLGAFGDILARARRMKILLVGRDNPAARGSLLARLGVLEKPHQTHLGPLATRESKSYIEHRLKVAGGGGKELFTDDAHAMIYQHTAGTARLINVLCDAALHAACMRASGHVNSAEILMATQDSRWPEALARDKPGAAPDPALAADSGSSGNPSGADSQDSETPPAELIVMHRKKRVAAWPLQSGRMSIGRAPDNTVQIDASYISRHHCQVLTVENVSTIEDLGSVNGLFFNGKAVKSHILKHADEIALGEHRLKYLVR